MAWQSISLTGLHSKTVNRANYKDLVCGTDSKFGSAAFVNFNGAYSAESDGSGLYYSGNAFGIEYDDTSDGITQLKIRFKVTHSGSNDSSNGYYIGLHGNKYLYKVKPKNTSWTSSVIPSELSDSTTTLTLTKNYSDTSFSLPACALVCTGAPVPYYNSTDKRYEIIYGDNNDRTFWYYITHKRQGFATRLEGSSTDSSAITIGSSRVSLVKKAADNDIGNAITITDNGNNTSTIKVPKFIVGTNNGISPDTKDTGDRGYQGKYIFIELIKNDGSSTIYRRNFPDAPSDFSEKFDLLPNTVKISVWAKGVSKYGGNVEKTKLNHSVVYYTTPTAPTKLWVVTGKVGVYPDNVRSSYDQDITVTNGLSSADNNAIKPKVKDMLMWKWSGYKKGTNAPIAGFRVFIYKNGTQKANTITIAKPHEHRTDSDGTIHLIEFSSSNISSGENTIGHYYDIGLETSENETNAQFGFIPSEEGFVKGDECTCKVYSYSYWGDKDNSGEYIKHFSDNEFDGTQDHIRGNCKLFAGLVWIKTADGWVEGTPYVKTATDTWVEADSVYVKTATNTWTEST